ncbi:vWA domain-containing protein [Deinococcus peraridilitoris]|uniref:Metal-dependent peptidase n=1 Tax=Deinococcus peraridilitoris (strain DSM 19664 / LMG 22246 / CIP 109416 / KR-200) TaxID=937777 RepID=L0A0G3_DEIPD|nr:VWA-like domain-containing protein [Deinococcus peraridilitoris]AFZ66949.1 hypothetical protein Deipe_1407 [Deinococcus peraridilitoris DSM 19664]
MTRTLQARLQRAVIQLRARHPFFGVLALHAEAQEAEELHGRPVRTACTDGRRVYVNPDFAARLSDDQLSGLLVHEVLHAALRHVPRSAGRDAARWNVAADIVVNGLAVQDGHQLPPGAVRRTTLEHLSVEEVYGLLSQQTPPELPEAHRDLFWPGKENAGDVAELDRFWQAALQNAAVTARLQGRLPAVAERALQWAEPQIDWRGVLWRYLTPSRTDFGDLDRRHLHRGLYLEELISLDLHVALCVDTSGSVSERQLSAFMGEVRGILRSFPHLCARLYFSDVALHGPYDVQESGTLMTPKGGGGTDFRAFFRATEDATLRVYLTDGHGRFPETEPPGDTLWAVPPGGLPDERFPFGQVLRLL